MDIRYAKILKWFRDNHPDKLDRWMESVSPNQILCKEWLVDQLCDHPGLNKPLKIEIIGSWFGWPLVDLLEQNIDCERIRLYDIDPFACKVARKYIEVFDYNIDIKTFEMSYWDHQQSEVGCDLLINTSSEHMKKTLVTLPHNYFKKPIIAIQSNNKTDESDHINCVFSTEELIEQSGCEKIYYAGEKDMGNYTRFMVIGK